MSRTLGLAAIQMEVHDGSENMARMYAKIKETVKYFPWVELIVFSEKCIFGRGNAYAEPIPGNTTEELCQMAREFGIWLLPGSMNEKTYRSIYNTTVVINPQGEIVTTYRKMYPWRPVADCKSGKDFCVFDIPGRARLGVTICYDQWFPEVVRQLTWMGAEIILNPILTTTIDRDAELVISQANALFNQVYFVSVNGLCDGGNGHSIIVDPNGRILQKASEIEQIIPEVIDLDLLARVRENGTLGMNQVLKSFRDEGHKFPVYSGKNSCEGSFAQLRSLGYKYKV